MLSQSTPVRLSQSSPTYPRHIACQFTRNSHTANLPSCEYLLFLNTAIPVPQRNIVQNQNQNCLLVTRRNDNHSPGPGPGRLGPSSHQRSELSNAILGTFSRGDKRVWKCIPIPNGLGGKATLINISISNGDLICHRMTIPLAPNQGDKVIFWYTGFNLQTVL